MHVGPRLPDEVLAVLFDYVKRDTGWDGLWRLTRVCTQWRRVVWETSGARMTWVAHEVVVLGLPLLDVRSAEMYASGHIRGATNFPLDTLLRDEPCHTRTMEMMASSTGLGVAVLATNVRDVACTVAWLRDAQQHVCEDLCLVVDEERWNALRALGFVEEGLTSRRLWRASPALETCIEEIEAFVGEERPWSALDLGCGTGRDAVFLAQRGWHVTAVDRGSSFLEKSQRFAERMGVLDRITTACIDLRPQFCDENGPAAHLLAQGFNLVNLSRFMNRPLLHCIRETVSPRTVVVVHHFLTGAVSRKGHPFRKAGQCLEREELHDLWLGENQGFDVLLDQEYTLPDGRPTILYAARRNHQSHQ